MLYDSLIGHPVISRRTVTLPPTPIHDVAIKDITINNAVYYMAILVIYYNKYTYEMYSLVRAVATSDGAAEQSSAVNRASVARDVLSVLTLFGYLRK